MKKYNPKSHSSIDDPLNQSVTYEEIMDIINKRHDFERLGDNDIM
jgi:hypothetical protein